MSKSDLQDYIKQDSSFYNVSYVDYFLQRSPYFINRYLFHMRKCEYYTNIYHYGARILKAYHAYKMRKLSYKLGFQFGLNTLGPGVKIYHHGFIVINQNAKIGKNVTLYPGVVVGNKGVELPDLVPTIGDNCFLGLGSKIFGKINIGNNVTVAPNSVVIKDVPDNCVVAGIPASVIKYK